MYQWTMLYNCISYHWEIVILLLLSCFRYNGSEIMLRDVQPRDEGDYSCQLNSIDHAIELVHHLDVLSKF